jgi:hypothetical protein
MVRTSILAPAPFEEAMALLGDVLAEKRRLELRVEALEKRLFGPRSEKLHLEDHQVPLLDEVFKNPVPAGQPSEKAARRKPVRRPLPDHLEVVEERLEPGKPTSPVLLKSPLGVAIRYTLGQWDALVRYLEDGRFEVDNNLVENAIRPTAVGKNWLFIGHPEAGWRSAVIYSLLVTARRAVLDPAKWLEDVLWGVPTATTANLHELLPENWKPATA